MGGKFFGTAIKLRALFASVINSSIFQLDFFNFNDYFIAIKNDQAGGIAMKGIPNRQKKVVTPKRDFKKDPKKFQQEKQQIPKRKG